MDLAVRTYRATEDFPKREQFGLAQQMRSAAVSVPSNVAEGCGRWTLADDRHFLLQARGSTYELETQIEVAQRAGIIAEPNADTLIADTNEVERLLNGMLRRLNTNIKK